MLNLDRHQIEFPCPRCGFYNPAFLRQVKRRGMIICRGCKGNIRLDDYMNQYRKAEREMNAALMQLKRTFSRKLEIKL